jgi:peptidoglycan/LPS O-acetylase OafA/YrhL
LFHKQHFSKPVNLPALTGLRFYAAAMILYGHSISYFYLPLHLNVLSVTTERIGNLGMTLFFVLSGFVIQHNYGNSLATLKPSAIWSFAVARFARLYPLYLLTLLLTLAFIPNVFETNSFAAAWPYSFTLTQDWGNWAVEGKSLASLYVGSAWSISAEVMLYLAYVPAAPLILLLTSVRSSRVALLMLTFVVTTIVILICVLWIGHSGNDYYYFYQSPYCRLSEFFLGAFTAVYYRHRTGASNIPERTPIAIMCVLAFLLIFAGTYTRYGDRFLLYSMSRGFAPVCAGLLFFFISGKSKLTWLVESAPALKLGNASYSIYLLSGWGLWTFSANGPSSNFADATFRLIMAVVFTIVLAFGSYNFVELPSRRWLRRLFSPSEEPVQAYSGGRLWIKPSVRGTLSEYATQSSVKTSEAMEPSP